LNTKHCQAATKSKSEPNCNVITEPKIATNVISRHVTSRKDTERRCETTDSSSETYRQNALK